MADHMDVFNGDYSGGDDMQDDLISRTWLLSEYDKRHKGPPGGARKLIEEAPSALGTDCISRQQAIKEAESWVGMNWYEQHLQRDVVEWLKELPSAQPEIIQCKDCKHYKYGMCMKICANRSTNGFCDWGER